MRKLMLITLMFYTVTASAQKTRRWKGSGYTNFVSQFPITMDEGITVCTYKIDSLSTSVHIKEYCDNKRGGLEIGFYEEDGRVSYVMNRNESGYVDRVYFFDRKGRLVRVEIYEKNKYIKSIKTPYWDELSSDDIVQLHVLID